MFTLHAVDWSSLLGSVYYLFFFANSVEFAVVAGGFFSLVPGFALGLFFVPILFFYFLFSIRFMESLEIALVA